MQLKEEHPQFFTASILDWKPLLKEDAFKDIILNSLSYLVENRRIELYAFVIMTNHLHLIWQMGPGYLRSHVQRDFLKFTAQQMRFLLANEDPIFLKSFEVNLSDRKYQFWKRKPLSIELYSPRVFEQKLDYIHNNPVKAGLCDLPENYRYSSASFYFDQSEEFPFLTHHAG